MKITAMLLAAAFCSINVSAAVGGYPVVLIHGLQPDNLKSKPNAAQVKVNGQAYWQEYWASRADLRIDWPSQERISGKIASDYIWPQLKKLSADGTCARGCIFVNHSTGDLITRYIIDNQALWLKNAGLTPLNIVATFDFSGAGGGSELADLAVNVATGGGLIDGALKFAVSLWLGEMPSAANVGVLHDLRVNTARQLAPQPQTKIPRLRFVGGASDYLGATSPFLPGDDDGVVAPHSSCGASQAASFESCSASIDLDGKLASQSAGVRNFMPYHYPMLMSDSYSHNATIGQARKGLVTAARSQMNYLDQRALKFSTYQESRGWWVFSSKYQVVTGSDRFSMTDLVFRAAN